MIIFNDCLQENNFLPITVSGQSPRLRWSYVLTGAHANVTAMFVDQVATVVCWLVAF